MLIKGRCHCGNIGFTLNWTPEPVKIPARACECDFCVKHGGVWTSCATGTLNVTVKSAAAVSRYAFATETAQFHGCAVCGVVPLVTSEIDDHLYAVVNVNTFEGVDSALLRHTSASFDNRDEAARLARRKRGWISSVEFG